MNGETAVVANDALFGAIMESVYQHDAQKLHEHASKYFFARQEYEKAAYCRDCSAKNSEEFEGSPLHPVMRSIAAYWTTLHPEKQLRLSIYIEKLNQKLNQIWLEEAKRDSPTRGEVFKGEARNAELAASMGVPQI